VVVQGLGLDSPQGDLGFVEILRQMGCHVERGERHTAVQGPPPGGLRGIDVDMRDVSDVAQTLAVVAPFCSSPVHIRGIGFIRAKETDRIRAPVRELQRLGVDAEAHDDGMTIRPSAVRPGRVATYEDHRMAMSFAVLGLVVEGIEIDDPGCTAKTYPGFFEDLAILTAEGAP
jgi:3-phosphoshikimate 1-carboxyvinyltransferase